MSNPTLLRSDSETEVPSSKSCARDGFQEGGQSDSLCYSTRRGGWWRFLGRSAGVIVTLIVLGTLLWIERAPVLTEVADLWIVSDPISRADAAVVLGGYLDVRPFAAAKLYKEGLVKEILVSRVDDNYPAVTIGVVPGHTEANEQVLLKLGVPPTAIETFGTANKTTKDEAAALRAWAALHHPSALIIPMDSFAARRVRWIFNKEFSGQNVKIEVPSSDPPNYSRTNWWHNDSGIITFQNEVLKYIYYRLKY
jgi:hypothetical protein